MAERDFSANMGAFMNSNLGLSSGGAEEGGGGEKKATTNSDVPADAIARPDYGNSVSRLRYAQKFREKYGGEVQGKADTPLNVNEIPRGGKSSAKNIATQAAEKHGLDPALVYASAMEEGMSGLFKNKATGRDTRNRKEGEAGYQDYYGDKDFPVNGANSFGLNTIEDRLPELIKGGYLPKDFAKNIRGKANEGQYSSWNFKNVETAMQAKAAVLKQGRDEVDKFADKNGIKLSDKGKDFFMLAVYNGGEGAMKRMLQYQKEGLLEDDKFLTERPKSEEDKKGKTNDVWGHIAPRFKMAEALKKEGYF